MLLEKPGEEVTPFKRVTEWEVNVSTLYPGAFEIMNTSVLLYTVAA